MKHLLRYIIIRLLLTIPMVFILLTIVFFVLRVMPGDPVSAMLGGHAPDHVIEEKKEELGLNRPIIVQYISYLWQICRLDLGNSMIFNQRVSLPIKEKIPATLELSICGMIVTCIFGVLLGAYAAEKRRTTQDYSIRLYGIVSYCIPVFWSGLMGQLIFGIWLKILPISGRTGPRVFASMFEKTGFYPGETACK